MHKWDWFVKWHFGCGISKIVGFKNWKSSFWHTQKKSLYFVDIGWPFVKFQKVSKSDFQCFFNVNNHPNCFELGAHFLLKVAQWKNDFIKRPHNTVNLNYPSQHWELGFCFGFCKEDNWVLHCKTVTQKRKTVLKNLDTEWQERKFKLTNFCCMLKILYKLFYHRETFISLYFRISRSVRLLILDFFPSLKWSVLENLSKN